MISGASGEIRAGYHVAARLSGWQIDQHEDSWQCDAAIVYQDEFWGNHAPALDLVLRLNKRMWRWKGVAVTWGADKVHIRGKGEPEVI